MRPTVLLQHLLVVLLVVVPLVSCARISISRGKKESKLDDLCARMHNNTALEGQDPIEMMQATAFECQKKCVDMFPGCSAVVYYYLHNETDKHFCYLFEKNSVHEKVDLVEQKAESVKDIVRMLEIVKDCHEFDAHPPLEEDGLASSTDKVDRKKRQNMDFDMQLGEWTDWSHCTAKNGHSVRSQSCDYGRKIQRRGCAARQQPVYRQPPQQPYRPPPPPPPRPQPQPQPQPPRAAPLQPRQPPQQPDQYAQLYQQRMAQYRENQRSPAVSQAAPCPSNRCAPPPPPQRCVTFTCIISTPPPQPRWHEWSEWTQCPVTCGDAVIYRRRQCSTGNNCLGDSTEQRSCNLPPCQTWSEWCEWSACPVTCGQGQRSRTRFCHLGTNRCQGNDFESETCDGGPCAEWTQWQDWSPCSATCGSGLSQRERTCLGGQPGSQECPGPAIEDKVCNERQCSEWAPWAEWGHCSASCGQGSKQRTRVCQYGADCFGPAEETQFCDSGPCASWTEWCEWSGCSSKCGAGQRTRTRSCTDGAGGEASTCAGASVETTLCEGTQCCRWSDWCGWSMCDKECGGGQSIRTRYCHKEGFNSADDSCVCEGPDREDRECNSQSCSPQCSWTQWCDWSDCSSRRVCDIGAQTRSRQCVGELGCHCFGPAEESQQCRGQEPCPQVNPCVHPQPCPDNNCAPQRTSCSAPQYQQAPQQLQPLAPQA